MKRRRWTFRFYWEPRDLWVGLYWESHTETRRKLHRPIGSMDLYFCLVPTLVLHLSGTMGGE